MGGHLGVAGLVAAVVVLGTAGRPTESLAAEVPQTTPGALRSYATIHSIGLEWDIQGDANHDATCTVQYRAQGDSAWRQALPLFRVDYAWYYAKEKAASPTNSFAGSILFLRPCTEYEVQLDIRDPDGGNASRVVTVTTRSIPEIPAGGRTLHVVPGTGGGAGSATDPFRGTATAEALARPGDILLLRAGRYGQVVFTKSGEEGGRYIVWKAAEDGAAVFDQITIRAGFLWLDGLTVRRAAQTNGIVAK